jgi:hypothetical protein
MASHPLEKSGFRAPESFEKPESVPFYLETGAAVSHGGSATGLFQTREGMCWCGYAR